MQTGARVISSVLIALGGLVRLTVFRALSHVDKLGTGITGQRKYDIIVTLIVTKKEKQTVVHYTTKLSTGSAL